MSSKRHDRRKRLRGQTTWPAALLGLALAAAFGLGACARADDEQYKNGSEQAALPTPPAPTIFVNPQPVAMRRLLARQYKNSIRTMFGGEVAKLASPPKDAAVDGYDAIGAKRLSVSDSVVSAYETSARDVAAAAIKNMTRIQELLKCIPSGPSDSMCHRKFAENFGRMAFRRPLTQSEIDRYAALSQDAAVEMKDFYAGLERVISAMLQSPHFLYMVETGAPLGEQKRVLSDYQLLTRMSYFLLDTSPDEVLLDLVRNEGLSTDDQIRFVAQAMLQRVDAKSALRNFYSELYRLRDLDAQAKDESLFAGFTPELRAAMVEETLRLIDDVVWERDVDFREMFTADYTFANAELAAFYKASHPGGGFARITLPPEQKRVGLLGHASMLARYAHTTTTSPTLRGKFVRERLLCETIPPPPPNVSTALPDPDPNQGPQTMKDRLIEHQQNPACIGCHKLMDNVGFALENFDAIGAFRMTDQGLPIDPTTEAEGLGVFSSPETLGAILRKDTRVATCLVRNLYRHGMGQLESEGEEYAIQRIALAFAASGYRVQSLLMEIVSSPAFRVLGVPQ